MTITADFSGGEKTATTEPLYQWDTGQKLALSGLPQTASDIQVHFANAAMPQAIVKATELVDNLPTCDIPNEFLQFGSAAKARAWVFYKASNTEGYTVRAVLIPITPRKRPNDYVSPEDPDSKGIVDRAIELLENYQSDLDSKLDDSDGSVKTANLDGGAVTEAKLAQAVKDIINAKEVKSNKKTTLTGNESSNDYYPTTKAVADALETVEEGIHTIIDEEVGDLKSDLSEMQTATSEDIGKALKAKAVENGKVTEWEFGEAGGEEKYEAKEKQYDAYSNSYCYVVGTGMVAQANRCLVRAEVLGYEKARITCPVTFGNETENKPNIYTLNRNSEVVSAVYLGDNYEVNSYEVSLDGVSLLGIVTNLANIGNIRIELLTPIIFEDDRVTPLIYEGASGINRCDINDFAKGFYIKNGKANFANGNAWRTSGYCYVKDLPSVVVRGHKEGETGTTSTIVYFAAVYDKNKNYIGGTTSPAPGVLGIPENGCYLRFSLDDTEFSTFDNIVVEKHSNPILVENKEYAPNRYYINAGEYFKHKGKKWVCVGDSLTERNIRATWFYHDYITFSTGISVYNMGKSGTGYHRGNSFYARIQNIPTDADVVTFFGSFNDLGDSYPLGTKDDTELTTVAGYINATFDRLNSILPMVPYGVITPTPWENANPMEYGDDSRASTYVNLLIDICKKRGIPLLDLYHCSLLRSWDMNYHDYAFSLDEANANTHPNSEGHKLIAPRIAAFLDTLIMPYGIETINW